MRPNREEFTSTVNYIQAGCPKDDGTQQYLGWNATIGPSKVAEHIDPHHWGWNAREHSSGYLAVEFSQGQLGESVEDSQFKAFAWYIRTKAIPSWPTIPMIFIMHSELPAGRRDGKTDLVPDGEGDIIRARIRAWLP